MNSERTINAPIAIIGCAAIASILACLLGPSIASFVIAGNQDGFTLDAFDYGPSPWWIVGTVLFLLGMSVLLIICLKIHRVAQG